MSQKTADSKIAELRQGFSEYLKAQGKKSYGTTVSDAFYLYRNSFNLDFLALLDIEELAGIQADCIVANIIADVIIHLAPSAQRFLRDGGRFIASGIIRERRGDVEKALAEAGYTVLKVVELGSWVAIVSQKS